MCRPCLVDSLDGRATNMLILQTHWYYMTDCVPVVYFINWTYPVFCEHFCYNWADHSCQCTNTIWHSHKNTGITGSNIKVIHIETWKKVEHSLIYSREARGSFWLWLPKVLGPTKTKAFECWGGHDDRRRGKISQAVRFHFKKNASISWMMVWFPVTIIGPELKWF